MPRKHACTDERIERIVQLISAGNYVETACGAVGIHPNTFFNWGRHAQAIITRDELDFADIETMRAEGWPDQYDEYDRQTLWFLCSVNKATNESEAFAVATIRKAMPTNPVAAMMWLERRFPTRWRKRTQIDVGDAPDETAAQRERQALESPESVAAMHRALELEAGGSAPVDADVVEE